MATRSIGPAKIITYQNSTLKICQSELKADSKISAGRNINNSKEGDIPAQQSIALPRRPSCAE